MADEKRIHLKSSDQFGYIYDESRTACGRGEQDEFVTLNSDGVTCKNCLNTEEFEIMREDRGSKQEFVEEEEDQSATDKQVGGSHYKNFEIQPVEFVLENEDHLHPTDAFLLNNVLKYCIRHRRKGGEDDLEKAKHYIDMVSEHTYE